MSEYEPGRAGESSMAKKILTSAATPVPLFDIETRSMLGGHTFERMQLDDSVLRLLIDTAEFRSRAMSYRDFNVAAGAWCLDPPKYGRVLGYNIKVDATDAVNIHAEDLVLQKAQASSYKDISVVSVVGQSQQDHKSGRDFPTLHPCGRCRERLTEATLISEKTLFVMAQPDFTVIQIATLPGIIAAHEAGDASGIATFDYPKTPAVFRPFEVAGNRVRAITPEEIDTTDYDSTIGAYLLERYVEQL